MMQLSKATLQHINTDNVSIPGNGVFALPEKVLQFGTGVLLRGLPDYYIDQANRQGIFNGRIVVVKSTDTGDASAFDQQDGLYTLCIRGVDAGQQVTKNVVCAAISRVLSAKKDWPTILNCAHDPQMQLIISNTTEVGITLVQEDIHQQPPTSFPGKLLAFLLERYTAFSGSADCGMVIIPTELISDNGTKLKDIVFELADFNRLDKAFIVWLKDHNRFCNSLVDRIVPGKPAAAIKNSLEQELGYSDELLTMSEVYSLWAIQGDDRVKEILSFAKADATVVIAEDITKFKELKLRLLNGTHTLSCGIALLAGFKTVREAMADEQLYGFIRRILLDEIAVAIPYPVPPAEANAFAEKVLDRFSNPSIEHQWLSITLNYSSKLKMRVVEVLKQYTTLYHTIPVGIAAGFVAYILFMKPVKEESGIYYGLLNGAHYPINDEKAGYFFELWQTGTPEALVNEVLANESLWGTDLAAIPGMKEKTVAALQQLMNGAIAQLIKQDNTLTD